MKNISGSVKNWNGKNFNNKEIVNKEKKTESLNVTSEIDELKKILNELHNKYDSNQEKNLNDAIVCAKMTLDSLLKID